MRKLKLLFTGLALMGGVISANAQTVPVFQESNSFSGTAVSELSTFYSTATTYTLELTGCVADQAISVLGGSISYTPTESGTVRFVRFGSTVYVYENAKYKEAIENVSEPSTPTYPTDLTSASTENLIQNGGFENTDDGTYSSGRYKPTHWTPYKSDKGTPGDGTSVRSGSELTGKYNMLMHYDGYYLTQQLASGVMKNFTPYQISFKFKANNDSQKGTKYRFDVGSAEFSSDYFKSAESSASTTSVQNFSKTFTTPAVIVDQPYVQLYSTTNKGSGSSQKLDRFDEFILVAANGGGIGITGATGATFLSGSAYAPEGVLAAEVEAERYGDATMRITNPTFDSNINGWNTPIGNGKQADNKQDYTRYFYESWNATPKEGRMYQVIENLPTGTYELEMIAFADQAGTMTPANTTVAVYAQGQEVGTTGSSYVRPNYVNSVNFTSYKAYAYVDGTGKIEIGMRQYTPAEFRWLGMDNVTLKYIATDNQEEAKMLALYQEKWTAVKDACNLLSDEGYTNVKGKERADLTTALAASVSEIGDYATNAATLKTAYLAFKAGKTNWDLLATEISKATALGASTTDAIAIGNNNEKTATDALQAVKDLKVTEYNYVASDYGYAVSLGSWNSTGPTGSLTAQHWSGESREYLEQSAAAYGQDSWDIVYDQDLALPAGNYVFKVAGRQANSDKVTLSLTVKKGESVIGTVADFPKGDTGLGINKSGATSFNSEDVAGFANSNNGRGWEWRYVKFTLASAATVKVSVEAHATAKSMWVSFCDATVQTDDETNLSIIAYNIALGSAQTTIADGTYSNVTGDEKTALQAAIDADKDLDKSDKDAIDAAKTLLETRTTAFTSAKSNYDAYVAAKAVVYEDNKPYAAAAKFTAIGTAQAAADATSASDADNKTAAIISAYRKYLESHALAEGVTGAEEITVADYRFEDVTECTDKANWKVTDNWLLDGQNNGEISFSTDNSLTDGDGNADYNYIRIQKSDNNAGIHQVINLEPGKYMMTVAARCQSGQGAKFEAFAGGVYVNITQDNNTNGQFGNGWNDVNVEFYVTETSDVNIGVKSDWGKNIWWTATRFRLVRLSEKVEVSAAGFATYVPSFDLNFSSTSIKAYKVKVNEQGVAKLTKVDEVPAGTPVLLYAEGGATENIPMMTDAAEFEDGTNDLVAGTGAAVATDGGTVDDVAYTNMILNNIDNKIGFYFANNQTVAANRAYLHIPTTLAPDAQSGARMVMVFENEETGISTMHNAQRVMHNEVYNLNGQRVQNPAKGLYIVNGRKVVVK